MKTFLTTILLASSALVATAADAPTITGKWKVHIAIADRQLDITCNLTQTGEELSGTCESPAGSVNLAGKVNAKKVTWSYKTNSEAGPITLNYNGSVESPTSIIGSVNVQEFGVDGEFIAKQGE